MGRNIQRQGEIIVAYMPYRDFKMNHTVLKKRPVLVISNENYNKRSNSLLICPLTTNIRNWNWTGAIQVSNKDVRDGTIVNSEIRIDDLYNLPKKDIVDSNGFLSQEKISLVRNNIISLISQ